MEVGPGPWLILSSEQVEEGNNVGEVGNKFAVEVRKSEERLNAFDLSGGFPFVNGGEFDRVHLNLSLANDHAKKFDAWNVEGALGQLERKSVFSKTKEYTTGTFMMECKVILGVNP